MEVPLRSGSLNDCVRINIHFIKDDTQLIHQRDIDIALRVFNDFGSFSYFNGSGFINTCSDHFSVYLSYFFGGFFTLREAIGNRRLVLGVDRLDYTKGIPQRLEAFGEFLARDPMRAKDVMMVQVAVPSRSGWRHRPSGTCSAAAARPAGRARR